MSSASKQYFDPSWQLLRTNAVTDFIFIFSVFYFVTISNFIASIRGMIDDFVEGV